MWYHNIKCKWYNGNWIDTQVSNRRQAIIWTNDDPVQRRIYTSLGLNELKLIEIPFVLTAFYLLKILNRMIIQTSDSYIISQQDM